MPVPKRVPHVAREDERPKIVTGVPFWGIHVVAIAGVIATGWSWSGFALAIGFYYLRMFGITAGYHRYFAHRSFKTGRVFQFILAFLGTISTQKGVLWWASHHRQHHRYSDGPKDIHSPIQRGLWWSHLGWIICNRYERMDKNEVKDLVKFPELVWIQKYERVIVVLFATSFGVWGGFWAFLWGYCVSTVMLWHGTFTINSLSHVWGQRRYDTTDDSRNNFLLALITMGEGWHNNHHYYQRSAAQGFYWWELDMSYMILKGLSYVGVTSGVNRPPRHVRDKTIKNTPPSEAPVPQAAELPRAA